MGKWKVVYTRQAQKDARKIKSAGLRSKTEKLLKLIADAPYRTPPPVGKLVGDLAGAYSRRINIQHRLVYQWLPNKEYQMTSYPHSTFVTRNS
ncbi:MAG TPA: Txe/YoeB family addiction module toxin [bacterium]